MSEELKPCPFCGGKAGLSFTMAGKKLYSVVCSSCKTMLTKYAVNDKGERTNLFYVCADDAIKAWNRRAEE